MKKRDTSKAVKNKLPLKEPVKLPTTGKTQKRDRIVNIAIVAAIIVALTFIFIKLTNPQALPNPANSYIPNPSSSGYDNFTQCLSEKGIKMYGAEWCSHCQNQKKMFGNSAAILPFVDCDKYSDECTQAGIEGFPTWVIDNVKYPGERPLEELSELSGCQLQ